MEYTEVDYEGEKIKIYNTIKPIRLEEETQVEYKLRRKAIKNYLKNKKTLIHPSVMLIPDTDDDGNIIFDLKGNPTFVGKSKGVTYRKEKKEVTGEHLEIVNEMEKLKQNG
jgi:hypothetical protein